MAIKKDTSTKTKNTSKTTKKTKTAKDTCTPVKEVTTYETINVDDLSKQKQDLNLNSDKANIKEETINETQKEEPIDMLIIHEESKPWSLPFTISIAIASVLVLLAMITGFPTIMYTILSAAG